MDELSLDLTNGNASAGLIVLVECVFQHHNAVGFLGGSLERMEDRQP
jgi:hypothetical protein